MNINKHLEISKEVEEALFNKKAVVALESTIISHGFPYPQNLECALDCENAVRENGAVPATIGIIKGKLKVGLSKEEIEYFAQSREMAKVSRRDLSVLVALGKDGATTVASTMIIADMAGIPIFATGGIGGVHRGAQETFDISADLMELASTNVAVVCAGAKSILDIGLTLEVLETHGVPVLGYKTTDFPAFYTRKSGFGVDFRCDSEKEVANILKSRESLGLNGGVLIANPIPEEYAMNEEYINARIEQTIHDAEAQGVRGKAVTPFILSALYEKTEGKSVVANKQLVLNNCRVAAKIAVALAESK